MKNRINFNHPAFDAIPPAQYWRFVIDKKQQDNSDEMGWLAYENRETGSVKSLLHAYSYMLATVNNKEELTESMIKEFHRLLLGNVLVSREIKIGEYRNDAVTFSIKRGKNGSTEGMEQLYDAFQTKPNEVSYSLQKDNSDIPIKPSKDAEIYYFKPNLTDPQQISEQVKVHLKNYYANLKTIATIQNENESRQKKLLNIIECVQNLELLHPFGDGNCRLFCILVLNKFLLENGFSPVILEDPNRFDGFTPEQLLIEIEKGMENYKALTQGKETLALDEIIKSQMDYWENKVKEEEELFTAPLHWAIAAGLPELVKKMLPAIKNINEVDATGHSVLMIAALHGDEELIKLLLAQPGIDVNQQDPFGFTAAMWAAQAGHSHVVEILMSSPKADNTIRSHIGLNLNDIQSTNNKEEDFFSSKMLANFGNLLPTLTLFHQYPFSMYQAITQKEFTHLNNFVGILSQTPPHQLTLVYLIFLYDQLKEINCVVAAKEQLLKQLKEKIMEIDLSKLPIEHDLDEKLFAINLKILKDFPNNQELENYFKSVQVFNSFTNASYYDITNLAERVAWKHKELFKNTDAAIEFISSRPEWTKIYLHKSNYTYSLQKSLSENLSFADKIMDRAIENKTILASVGNHLQDFEIILKDQPEVYQKLEKAYHRLQEDKKTDENKPQTNQQQGLS